MTPQRASLASARATPAPDLIRGLLPSATQEVPGQARDTVRQ